MSEVKPIRIQRKRTKGWKMPENTVYVGRPSKCGNPYPVGKNFTAKQAVRLYRKFAEQWNIEEDAQELKGKNLACFCPLDQPCHADVLLELANKIIEPCQTK
jgi:hypothetical protein